MYDIILNRLDERDTRDLDFVIKLTPMSEVQKDLHEIEKKFNPQVRDLNKIHDELRLFTSRVKKRISNLKESNAKGAMETEAELYGLHLRSLDSQLSVVKEKSKLSSDIIKLIQAEKKLQGGLVGDDGALGLGGSSGKVMAAYAVGDTINIDKEGMANPIRQALSNLNASQQNTGAYNINAGAEQPQYAEYTNPNDIIEPIDTNNVMHQVQNSIEQQNQESYLPNIPESDDSEDMNYGGIDYNLSKMNLHNKKKLESGDIKEYVHYDRTNRIFWVDAKDKDGKTIPYRSKSIKMMGVDIKPTPSGSGNDTITDDLGITYDVVYDTVDNMPKAYEEMWKTSTNRYNSNGELNKLVTEE